MPGVFTLGEATTEQMKHLEDNDSSERFKKVFKDVFYNTHNQYHYDRMME